MKSVGRPVSKPGASKSRFLTSSRSRVPMFWTVSDSPSGTTSPCSSPNREVTAAATRNSTSPRWVSSVASLVYWCRSPYRYVVPSAVVVSRRWNPRRRTAVATSAAATSVIAARSGSRGSKNGSGWATRTVDTSRHSFGVRSSVQITMEVTSTTRPIPKMPDLKMPNAPSRSRTLTMPGPSTGSYRTWMASIAVA